jgi:CDP-6-deoxy-D-xylo-4-hexulose-3-dehydrase
MVREVSDRTILEKHSTAHPDLSPDFIFAYPAYNVRNTEIGAVFGRNQLKRLDDNNIIRRKNLEVFLDHLDSRKYRTDFDTTGSCNYAFNLVLKEKDPHLRDRLEKIMQEAGIEFRRGSSGGGNQLRQPYLKSIVKSDEYENYPEVEHIHFYGYYIGNHPNLKPHQIIELCSMINAA